MTMSRQEGSKCQFSDESKDDVGDFEAELLADLEDEDLQVHAVPEICEALSPCGLCRLR